MRLRQHLAAPFALAAVAAWALTGCGNTSEPSAEHPPPTITTPTSTGAPGSGPTVTQTPTPVSTPTETEGNGDSEGDDTPATAGGGICGDLSSSEVGAVLGGTTTGAALPGGGCGFTRTSAKAPSATFVEKSLSKTPGGMDGAKTEATSSVEGDPQDLTGIGDAAFVVTGTAFGEPAIQGAGAVRIGNRIINVNLNQNGTMSAPAVKALVVKLLRLAATQAS